MLQIAARRIGKVWERALPEKLQETNLMPTNKGFTLIELAVVLAIIAILAAVLTPIVTGYIDQARQTRGQGDVRAIATSILNYQ